MNREQTKPNRDTWKKRCFDLYFMAMCTGNNKTANKYPDNDGTSRQMSVSMSTDDMNIYDGILLSGTPALTLWTSYNTRGEKTFGIDITEYVVGFIET